MRMSLNSWIPGFFAFTYDFFRFCHNDYVEWNIINYTRRRLDADEELFFVT